MPQEPQDYQDVQAVIADHDSRRNRRVFWICAFAVAVVALIGGRLLVEKAKERARWNLVYECDFTHATLADVAKSWSGSFMPWGKDFQPAALDSSSFALGPDGLTLRGGAGYTDLAFQGDFIGSLRVEWDYRRDTGSVDYNCFIGGQNRLAGYAIHVGGWDNPSYVALTRGPKYEIVDSTYMAHPLIAGQVYHYVLEQGEGRLRLTVGDERVLDVENPSEIYGDHSNTFGFDAVGIENLRVLSVKVYHKPLARRISPLAVGDKLMQIGDYARAGAAYLDVVRSYPDEDLTVPASFRYAICQMRLDDARGCELLERYIADHPRDHAVPYALLELIHAKRRAGDQQAVERLGERCAAWKGEPVLKRVLGAIADQRHDDLVPSPVTKVGESEWPTGSCERIITTIADLRRWGERFGVDWWGNSYAFDAGGVLQYQGRQEDILAAYPPRSQFYQEALLHQCRYQDLLELSQPGSSLRALALVHLGRQAEVIGGEHYPEWIVSQVMLDQGRLAEMVAQPDRLISERPRLLALAGRYQEVLDHYPDDQSAAAAALTALGRIDEIEARTQVPRVLATMLVDMRRYDELFTRFPTAYEELYRAALHLWIEGDRQRARALVEDLAHASMSPTLEATRISRHVFPGLLRVWSGEAGDPRALLADEIAEAKRDRRPMLWYLLSYIVGDIDEASFRLQPDRYRLDERLLLAKALAADIHGRADEARALYARCAELPSLNTSTLDFDIDFVRWRAGLPLRAGPPMAH